MKIINSLLISALLLGAGKMNAQLTEGAAGAPLTEGKITYLLTTSFGSSSTYNPATGSWTADGPSMNSAGWAELSFKGGKSHVKIKNELGESETVVIGDSGIILYNNQKVKEYIRFGNATKEAGNTRGGIYKKFKVLTTKKKVIEGYECTLAIIKLKKRRRFRVWFTDQIKASDIGIAGYVFKGISGTPLLVQFSSPKFKVEYRANGVSAKKVDDAIFTPDRKGYTEVKPEEKCYFNYYRMWSDRWETQRKFQKRVAEENAAKYR